MDYQAILQHYQNCLAQHGDTPQGADWPNAEGVRQRYAVMADLLRTSACSVLDYGCGTGDFYAFLRQRHPEVVYHGVDVDPLAIEYAKQKYPDVHFDVGDRLAQNSFSERTYDYIVLNGVFTEKCSLSFDAMWEYCQTLLSQLFAQTQKGLAFNVMSACVDWQRDDLFHLPMSTLELFLTQNLSKQYVMRRDYGLYEYTCYVYR